MDILGTLTDLFKTWGYFVVFFGVMLENAGLPVPGETILLAAGFFASQHHFSLLYVILIAALGAVLGDNCGYWIGRKLGRKYLLYYGKYILLTRERFRKIESFFTRHGDKTVLVARFITGLRVFTALVAGATKMVWPRFLIFNMIGAALWSVAISLLGFFFGSNWDTLERWIKRGGWILAAVAVMLLLIYVGLKRRNKPEST